MINYNNFFVEPESTSVTNVQSVSNTINQPSNIVDMQGSISQNNSENVERATSPTVEKKGEETEAEVTAENDESSSLDAKSSSESDAIQKEVIIS